MKKNEFLNQLKHQLSHLDKNECHKFIAYYDEMIEDYLEDGFSEKEAVKMVGNPKVIIQNILDEHQVKGSKSDYQIRNQNNDDSTGFKIFFLTAIYLIFCSVLAFFNFIDENLAIRIVTIATNLFIIGITYLLKKGNRMDLITPFTYSKNFNPSRYGPVYLSFMLKSALILFVPAIFLSLVFQYFAVTPYIDMTITTILGIFSTRLWYKKSKALT